MLQTILYEKRLFGRLSFVFVGHSGAPNDGFLQNTLKKRF